MKKYIIDHFILEDKKMWDERKLLLRALFVLIVAVGAARVCEGAFVEERSSSYTGLFEEWSSECAGLCFIVQGGGDWPHLKMDNFFDQYSGHDWVDDYAGTLDVGRVRTGSGSASCSLTDRTWCYRHYSAPSMEYYVSRLSPAVLFVTSSQTFDVFAGSKSIGTSAYGGLISRSPTSTTAVPSYMAYSTSGGVVVTSTSSTVNLSAMNKSWVLFWWGSSSWYLRSKIPNYIEGRSGCEIMNYVAGGNQFIPSDMPVLVVFENKPTQVAPVDQSLRFSFGTGGAGSASIMPLYGQHQPFVSETSGWSSSVPSAVSNRCSTWAARLKYFPLSCTESREIVNAGETVTIRDVFTYLDLADQWGTTAERIAPCPPAVNLAKDYGYSITLSGTRVSEPVATHSGPYTGLSGTTTVEYSVSDMDKYIYEEIVSPAASGDDMLFLQGEIQSEIQDMTATGDLAAGFSFGRKFNKKYDHFNNSGEGVLALAEAYPYLSASDKTAAASYVSSYLYSKNPLTADNSDNLTGTRREYFSLLSSSYHETVSSGSTQGWSPTYITELERADNIYALWAFARASGDWSYVQNNYSTIQSICSDEWNHSEWGMCGYFRDLSPAEAYWPTDRNTPSSNKKVGRGSNAATNGRFGHLVAMARVADHQSDSTWRDRATYMLARTAIQMAAQWNLNRYFYDAAIQTIEENPDWCVELSASSGEGDEMLLCVDYWADGSDSPMFMFFWDEFGPTLGVKAWPWWDVLTVFEGMTPECGRFVADNLSSQVGYMVSVIEENAPAWHEVERICYVGRENSMDNPKNAFRTYMTKAYAMQQNGVQMLKYLDIPVFKVGDLYQIRRHVANLRCFGGHQWQTIQ